MGRVASKLTRPIRTFNIENRARRALEKQHAQGIAAPKHPSTVEHIAKAQQEHPEFLAEQQERNEVLHEKLKGLYVEGDAAPQGMKTSSKRPLPESRKANPETDLGSMETFHTVPSGKANLKTILDFIGQHQIDPNTVTSKTIARDYDLDEEEVSKVLASFKALTFHIPQEMYKQNPKLKKIVAEQIESVSSSVSQFKLQLPGSSSSSSSSPSSSVDPSSSNTNKT